MRKYRNQFDDVIGEEAEEDVTYATADSVKDILDNIESDINTLIGFIEDDIYDIDDILYALKEISVDLY